MNVIKRGLALLLCASMIASLTGCGSKKEKDDSALVLNYEGKANVPANSNTKWIDSDIYGMIDSTVNVSEKDDFYTAVNKDWLLEQTKPTVDDDDRTLLMEGEDIVKERLIDIVSGEKYPEALDGSQVDINDEEIAHDQELVVKFVNTAADWDSRNAAGVQPLKKYIEDIAAISSMDELTDFIIDLEGRNASQQCLLDIACYAGAIDPEYYRCLMAPDNLYVLNEANAYTNMSFRNRQEMRLTDKVVIGVMTDLGYDEKYAKKVAKNCYNLEGKLIDHTNTNVISNPDNYQVGYTLDELKKLAGKYPLEKIYNAYGYTLTDDIRIADKGYLKYLNRIYTKSNLELLKSYFIVHTINNNILLLNRDYYDLVYNEHNKYNTSILKKDEGKGDVKEVEIKDEWDLILNNFAMPYMGGPLNVVYVSRYCSSEQKEELIEMVDEIIENYHKLIDAEDWMSDSARESTHEKLDYLTIRVLYPDKVDSYKDLQFDDKDDLVSMILKINHFKKHKMAEKANTPVNKEAWDLDQNPTTTVNACYMANDNSINIFAGIVSGENVFNVDNEDEVNYARIGTVVGHEVSHAFDSSGCHYDKFGYKKNWWDMNDLTSFQLRVTDLSNYYGGISPFPGQKNLIGSNFTGEAIADMGGMSVVLMIAKEKGNFDYDLFFKSYAELWRASRSLGKEKGYAEQDVHPLAYLRTNITLSQFDEFIDTYNITEGDGMYWDKDKRIKVW